MRAQGDEPGDHSPGDPSDADGIFAVGRLKRRADFLHVGKGRRWHGKAVTLQASPKPAPALDAIGVSSDAPRIGFTLTKKVGNAVVRNRARRRLREAVRLSAQLPVRAGHDYVVVGRLDAIRLPFEALKHELDRAMRAVHTAAVANAGAQKRRGGRNAGTDSAKGTDPSGSGLERTRPKS